MSILVSLEIKFTQSGKAHDYSKPRYYAKFSVANITFKMHKDQFDNIVEIMKIIELFQKLQHSLYRFLYYAHSEDTKKYKTFRPLCLILKPSSVKELKGKYKNENAVLWWKYAIGCTIKINREKKGKKGQFRISDVRLKMFKRDFMILYARIANGKELAETDKPKYQKILSIFDTRQLKVYLLRKRICIGGQQKY